MANTRSNVWDLGGDWADPILWYARGVAAMQARPLAVPTSWRFYAGMHGFSRELWERLGYLQQSDQDPEEAIADRFWNQCQHTSWYFLPWHRGYLLAFEANIRAAVVQLGGPADWALPYWNYFKPDQSALPRAFASPDWPDGTGDNPLFVRQRYGPRNDGNVFVPPFTPAQLAAMNEPDFTGVSSGGSPGFGGVDTGFSHGGGVVGRIEDQPHGWVHVMVGGRDPQPPGRLGAMTNPATAGLDPIFWLHHANIDRLWESWNAATPPRPNPTDARWVGGPAGIGERAFVMPMPDGSTWTFTPGEMTDIKSLEYEYDDLSPTMVTMSLEDRLERLRIPALAKGALLVPDNTDVELVGATTAPLSIRGSDARDRIRLDSGMRRKVASTLMAAVDLDGVQAAPDRLFLNLENVRGRSDAAAFHVFVGVPDDEEPADHPDRLAGSIAPFGMSSASMPDQGHAGQGLTFVLEITDIVDRLQLEDSFDVEDLPIRIMPVNPIADEAEVSIGRISVFRQGH